MGSDDVMTAGDAVATGDDVRTGRGVDPDDAANGGTHAPSRTHESRYNDRVLRKRTSGGA